MPSTLRIQCDVCERVVATAHGEDNDFVSMFHVTYVCMECDMAAMLGAAEMIPETGHGVDMTGIPVVIHNRDVQEFSLTPSTYDGEDDETFGPWANPSENPDYPE